MINTEQSVALNPESWEGSKSICELLGGFGKTLESIKKCFFVHFEFILKFFTSAEFEITDRTPVAFIFKRSKFLRELGAANRTGEFEFLIVEYPQCFSSVDSRTFELPILPTLEKLSVNDK